MKSSVSSKAVVGDVSTGSRTGKLLKLLLRGSGDGPAARHRCCVFRGVHLQAVRQQQLLLLYQCQDRILLLLRRHRPVALNSCVHALLVTRRMHGLLGKKRLTGAH
jgi:hypothetical protein